VVSKPEQVRKQKSKKTQKTQKMEQVPQKKTLEDVVMEGLSRIESTCLQQKSLLCDISSTIENHKRITETLFSTLEPTPKKAMNEQLSPFEMAFQQFVEAFERIDADEKAQRIRKVVRRSGRRDTESLSELLNQISKESFVQQQEPRTVECSGPCQCPQCPYQLELDRIDKFENDLLINAPLEPLFVNPEVNS